MTARFWLLLSTMLILQTQSAPPDYNPLHIGDALTDVRINSNNTFIYYQLFIDSTYQEGNDVIVKVIPLDYNSDPDIFISKTNPQPTNYTNSEWVCGIYGRDTCSIHHRNVSIAEPFYVGIFCLFGNCTFNLKVLQSDELTLENGVDHQFYMESQDAKIFKFLVPPTPQSLPAALSSLASLASSEILIKASAYRSGAHDFTLMASTSCPQFANSTEQIPSSDYSSKKGIQAWRKGLVLRLTKDDFLNKNWEGCLVDIVLDGVDSGEYHISAEMGQAVPMLYNQQQVDGIVMFGNIQCYKYFIKESNTDFQIYLTTYSGRVDIGVHPSSQNLTKFEDILIKRENEHDAILDVRGGMRRWRLQQETGLYFVCVKGTFTSSYSLKVREYQQDRQKGTLEDGYAEQFGIRNGRVRTYIYKVPDLDYSGEDIELDISMVIKRGNNGSLGLLARPCPDQNLDQCRENAQNEITSKADSFQRAQDNGAGQFMKIDHNETWCTEQLKGNCYYVFVVYFQVEGEHRTLFELLVQHTQNNHLLVKESSPLFNNVDEMDFKYYKFVLAVEDPNIEAVKIELLPVHGDSDIYVSRVNQFPNKTNYEKRSMKVGSTSDHVEFCFCDKSITTLVATYYIGVYGYSYASYGLLVSLKRTNITQAENLKAQAVHLYENMPIQKSLHKELDLFFGYFEVEMGEGEERTIEISVANLEQKTQTYVSFGEAPTTQDYQFKTTDGVIKISPQDKNFHSSGIYYVLTKPYYGFLDLFKDNYYKFQLAWKMESSISYLNAHSLQQVLIEPQSFAYFKHYILDTESDVKISLLKGGQQDLVVSAHSGNQYPDLSEHDFTSMMQIGSNFNHGKSLYIKSSQIKAINPACIDLGYADSFPCVLYIGIYCRESTPCHSSIDLEYENDKPKKIAIGQAKHSTMSIGYYSYYYISVAPSSLYSDIYAVLSPLYGEVDLFANLVSSSQDMEEWSLPTNESYVYKSNQKLKTEVIHIPKLQLEQCFALQDAKSDCVLIFGIQALEEDNSQSLPANDTSSIQAYYNFIVYKDVMELKNEVPVTGYVRAGQFSYFIYQSTCQRCSLIIGLSSYSNGNPDLYVVKTEEGGESRLPTLQDFDFRQATLNSEILSLGEDSIQQNGKKMKQMDGYYIIGVYGGVNTTFQLTISSSQSSSTQMSTLTEGLPLKNTQEGESVVYYQYYNWGSKDIEVSLSVSTGVAHIYVDPFRQEQNLQSQLAHLTSSSRWKVENIDSITQGDEGKEVLILNQDRYYCSDCMYLIAVQTELDYASYSLVVKGVDAEKSYSHLLKIGEQKVVKIKSKGGTQIFQFMIESKDAFTVTPTLMTGEAMIYLSYTEDPSDAFLNSTGKSIIVRGALLLTETNYYIIIESLTPRCDVSLSVFQRTSILTIHDGIPQMLYYSDIQDASKFMTFPLAPGNQTVIISVKSKTKMFFPVLYTYLYDKDEMGYEKEAEGNGGKTQNLLFPPNDQIIYTKYGNETEWDKELYILKQTIEFSNLGSEVAGLALNLMYHRDPEFLPNSTTPIEDKFTSAIAVITVSKSSMIKLIPDIEHYGEIKKSTAFTSFIVYPEANKSIYVSLSTCLGNVQVSMIRSETPDKKEQLDFSEVQGQSLALIRAKNGPVYLIVEPVLIGASDNLKREFLIKVHLMNDKDHQEKMVNYISKDGGVIKYEYLPGRERKVKFNWGPLYEIEGYLQKESRLKGVRYEMLVSTNPNARLDQVCAAKRRIDVVTYVDFVLDQTEKIVSTLEIGKELYFNIIAVKDDSQIAIPYRPVTIFIPKHDFRPVRHMMMLFAFLVVGLCLCSIYFYRKSNKLKKQLQEEVREIISSSSSENTQGPDMKVSKYNRVGGGEQ